MNQEGTQNQPEAGQAANPQTTYIKPQKAHIIISPNTKSGSNNFPDNHINISTNSDKTGS
jgi:hypothetical protein